MPLSRPSFSGQSSECGCWLDIYIYVCIILLLIVWRRNEIPVAVYDQINWVSDIRKAPVHHRSNRGGGGGGEGPKSYNKLTVAADQVGIYVIHSTGCSV